MFKDISKFSRISDYLPIFNGVLLADILIMVVFFYTTFFKAPTLIKWYKDFGLSAVLADVTVMIGFILARYLYPKLFDKFTIVKFLLLILGIQIIHDILFYVLVIKKAPRNWNKMIDLFKDYAAEEKGGAILGDSIMVIIAVILHHCLVI